MSASLDVDFDGKCPAHSALLKLAYDLRPMAGENFKMGWEIILTELATPRSEKEWIKAAQTVRVALVESGIQEIKDLGLLPARSPYSISEISILVRSALRAPQYQPDPHTIRAAKSTGMAFFSWALSGLNHLPALGQYVVGLAGTGAAQSVSDNEGGGRGAAYRLRKIARINEASKLARREAAINFLTKLADLLKS